LAKHIPTAYAPTGSKPVDSSLKDPSTKFCYRHRPDLKCRRTADEPSMDNLQRVSAAGSYGLRSD
jgi:F-box/WD-40 domain protein MET30